MNFTDLIWELPNAIPNTLCDGLVNLFEERKDLQKQGMTATGVDLDAKVSTDFPLNSDISPELDKQLFEIMTQNNKEYIDLYAKSLYPEEIRHTLRSFPMYDTGYQIQKTAKDGFYTWHHDFDFAPILDTLPSIASGERKMLMSERICTFIYYLTDDFEGGRTQFYFNGDVHSVVPQKGKALWFPSNTMYLHRGEPVISGEKYIVTGWIYFDSLRGVRTTTLGSEEIRSKLGEENMVFLRDGNLILDRPVQ